MYLITIVVNELEPNTAAPAVRTEGSEATFPRFGGWQGGFDFNIASFQMTALGRLSGREVVVEDRDSMAVIIEIKDLPWDEELDEITPVEIFPVPPANPES